MTSMDNLQRVVQTLRQGGVIACPTEAVWGLSCDPDNDEALAHLMRLKERDPAKGVILVAASIQQFGPWLESLPLALHAPLAASWPGPHTWLVPDNGRSHGLVRGAHQSVALRVTDHPGMRALCEAFGGPLVSTSANRAAEPPAMSADEVRAIFGDELDAMLDGELGGQTRPSTIRDLVTNEVLRA
ncbi:MULTISPECIES: L-threonylcarbamoyladenylate synthase [unclassified Halomonas]|uniref:L-threonylcarbamoyladenylate synthase n=1 Tax=unclassified Halomonas TaxID=2609666 RepID=UPI0021E3A243|nr:MULTISPECIES: L-threonylcarbamoyladenylate synthase [unclassified Halomonas]UYF99238.1 L-threonylcarbamoyladenylate synthase [Halomonas sp. GD1P12]WNL39605.1 L-threonylcarbamoyladenylate synthase [Halomonas sp. PAMB 3232]WNL42962.1 L-threonylcarbamoyladenylate synthase [Halomonas sp. PAMB 3264]